jgi:putative transposase
VTFIDAHRERFGVEPICQVLEIAPSTYYAARCRPPSLRSLTDAVLCDDILRVWKENYSVYGARKVWLALNREGIACGRDRVERLMKHLDISGARRGRTTKTTLRDAATSSSLPDLVNRSFVAERPNQLWVADITYVPTYIGFVYTAFVVDVFSRRIVGWAIATHLRTELPLAALDMALYLRDERLGELVHHSDRGSQYTSIRYTERLEEFDLTPSVGSRGDSYDNAVAETVIGLYKTELIHGRSWIGRVHLERETLAYVDWYNTRRLHGACGDVPPAEFEAAYYRDHLTSGRPEIQ